MRHIENRIEEHMTPFPSIASRRTPIAEAQIFMKEMEIRHLPVLEGGRVVGLVSERDLKQALPFARQHSLTVADVMSPDPYCVKVGTRLSEVAEKMARRKVGSAVVMSSAAQVVGIFTTTDALRVLTETLSSGHRSSLRDRAIEELLSGTILTGRGGAA